MISKSAFSAVKEYGHIKWSEPSYQSCLNEQNDWDDVFRMADFTYMNLERRGRGLIAMLQHADPYIRSKWLLKIPGRPR